MPARLGSFAKKFQKELMKRMRMSATTRKRIKRLVEEFEVIKMDELIFESRWVTLRQELERVHSRERKDVFCRFKETWEWVMDQGGQWQGGGIGELEDRFDKSIDELEALQKADKEELRRWQISEGDGDVASSWMSTVLMDERRAC